MTLLLSEFSGIYYQSSLPLTVILTDATVFVGEKLLRIVPDKRIVLAGQWQTIPAVAKLFLQTDAESKILRERKGLLALDEANIKTPRVLHFEWTEEHDAYVIIFEYLDKAVTFKQLWTTTADDQKYDLLNTLIAITAKLHSHGLYQKDCHLENFLYENNEITVIDGATVVKKSKSLNQKNSLDNLAVLMAQFNQPFDHYLSKIIAQYMQLREWQTDPTLYQWFLKRLTKWRNYRERIYLEKTLRTCTAFIVDETWHYFCVWDRNYDTPQIRLLLQTPSILFYRRPEEIFSEENYDATASTAHESNLVVRRYELNFWQRIKHIFITTPARAAWLELQRQQFIGMPTIQPIALIEYRWGIIPKVGYLIVESGESYVPKSFKSEELDKNNIS